MSMTTARPHRRHRSVGAALAGLAVLVPVMIAGAGTASAQTARPVSPAISRAVVAHPGALGLLATARSLHPEKSSADFVDFIADIDKVTSSTGVKLDLSIDADNAPSFPQGDSMDVTLENAAGTELHQWSFTEKALTSSSNGSGTVKSSSADGSYATVSLSFTPTGSSKRIEACNAENYTLERAEKVTGHITVDSHSTGSHSWGDVTASSLSFEDAVFDTTFTGTPTCEPSSEETCVSDVGWSASTSNVVLFGASGNPPDIFADRSVALGSPKGATRQDLIIAKAPAPVLTTSGTSAAMKIATSGNGAAGSGALASTAKATTSKEKCKTSAGKVATDTSTDWSAKFGSDSLKFTGAIFSPIVLGAKYEAGISRDVS